MMLKLYPYQEHAKDFLLRKRRVLLTHEMGLGKTATALEVLRVSGVQKILVVAPRAAIYVWQSEGEKWIDRKPTAIMGTPHQRGKLYDEPFAICTYEIMRIDMHRGLLQKYDMIIFDEAHKLKNRKSQTFKAARAYCREAAYVFLVTGTPASRGSQDLWAYMNLLNRKVFTSYWKWVNTFCHVEEGQFGKLIYGTRNVDNLKILLGGYMHRRTKRQVLPELPLKTRQILQVEMTREQRKIYLDIADEMVAELDTGGIAIASTTLGKLMLLRQLLVCPKIIDPELGYGAGLELILETIKDYDDHFVLFTPFTKAIPFIRKYLERDFSNIITLQGGMDPQEVGAAIEAFKWDKGVAICSIRFAQSFSMETAPNGFFLGQEHDPILNNQAEDRLHRMTTIQPVICHYLKHKDTVEETDIFPSISEKVRNVNSFMNPKVLKDVLERSIDLLT